MIQIITYINPDLDGYACALGYAELLQKQEIEAEAVIIGVPVKEVQYILEKNKFTPFLKNLDVNSRFILVDASDVVAIDSQVDPLKVIEVIDHRIVNQSSAFVNAKIQIELVGAAATLIVEKFIVARIEPTQETAALLLGAIVSNTINFHNNVTTERDRVAAEWLKKFTNFDERMIDEMFKYASEFDVKDWQPYFASFEIAGKKIGIAQLEIVNVKIFVENNLKLIKGKLQSVVNDFDYCFLTCVDLAEYSNSFVSTDLNTREMLQNILNISFTDVLAKSDGIIMRKELVPLIKNYLEK